MNIFGYVAIDSGVNYYSLFVGTADNNNADTNPYHVYLVVSTDHGQTWSKPIQVDHDANGSAGPRHQRRACSPRACSTR